jgi:hypothetical protein
MLTILKIVIVSGQGFPLNYKLCSIILYGVGPIQNAEADPIKLFMAVVYGFS